MSDQYKAEFTQLLVRVGEGDNDAAAQLFPLVYDELRRLAHRRTTAAAATLNSTALIHEAYIRLGGAQFAAKDRQHFIALAARAMRMVLVDYLRTSRRQKRGGQAIQVTLAESMLASKPNEDLLLVDEALTRLSAIDKGQAEIVELFYFAGLSYPEIASQLGLSEATVHRRLRAAKAWLNLELSGK